MDGRAARALRSRLKVQHLQAVTLLDETQSMTKAAERLHVTRAALSKTIASVEELLGVQLYLRTAAGLSPTQYGTALARHARIILGDIQSAEDEIRDLMSEHRERVSIGAFFVSMPVLLPQAISSLSASHPRCLVSVREGDMLELIIGLQDGEFDVIVGRVLPEFFRGDVAVEPLYEERLFAVCRADHALAGAGRPTWRSAASCPWVLPPKESPVRRSLQARFSAEGLAGPEVVIEALSIPLTIGLLEQFSAIGLLPERVANDEQRRSGIAVLPLEVPPLPAPMGVAWRRDRPLPPLARALIEALRSAATRSP